MTNKDKEEWEDLKQSIINIMPSGCSFSMDVTKHPTSGKIMVSLYGVEPSLLRKALHLFSRKRIVKTLEEQANMQVELKQILRDKNVDDGE